MDEPTTTTTAPQAAAPDPARLAAAVNLVVVLAILAHAERSMRRRRLADALTVFGLTLLVAALYRVLVHTGAAPAIPCPPPAHLP